MVIADNRMKITDIGLKGLAWYEAKISFYRGESRSGTILMMATS